MVTILILMFFLQDAASVFTQWKIMLKSETICFEGLMYAVLFMFLTHLQKPWSFEHEKPKSCI